MKNWLPILISVVALVPAIAQADVRKPNLMFILVDNQGYNDLGCYGATEV